MIEITIPTTDVNSEHCTVIRWRVADRHQAARDEVLVEVETSKAVIEVVAPSEGFVSCCASEGSTVPMGSVIARLFPDLASLNSYASQRERAMPATPASGAPNPGNAGVAPKATKDAERLASSMGVDLNAIGNSGLITRKHVEAYLRAHAGEREHALPSPLAAPSGAERVLLIGSGRGAEQVLEILRACNSDAARTGARQTAVVALVDDYAQRWGEEVEGIPVVGGADRIVALAGSQAIDSAIITISSSVPARVRFRELCNSAGLLLRNAIDPSCRLPARFTIGLGNVICALCHFGTGSVVGDNNFLSAYNSYDHHCTLGDDISTGPGVMASGTVTVESRVRMGTGVFIEPGLTIGADAQITSGAIIMQSVPQGHAVKYKTGQTTVTAIRRS